MSIDTKEATFEYVEKEFFDFLGGREFPPFKPVAYYDEDLDCIRVVVRECSTTEVRINRALTLLEDNFPNAGDDKFVGFNIKGVRYFCAEKGWSLDHPIRLSSLLDAIVRLFPDMSVELAVALAKKMIPDQEIEVHPGASMNLRTA